MIEAIPGPSHSGEPLGTPMVPTKLWNPRLHAIPSSLREPQFFPISGIDQVSNSLSILAVFTLNLALYSEMIVFFWPPVAATTVAAGAIGCQF